MAVLAVSLYSAFTRDIALFVVCDLSCTQTRSAPTASVRSQDGVLFVERMAVLTVRFRGVVVYAMLHLVESALRSGPPDKVVGSVVLVVAVEMSKLVP